jgi:DNA-directed RNA polymerase subunit RPC12/RpoP
MPKIRCECQRVLAYREDQAGKRVKCPACSAKLVLPGVAPATAQPPGAAQAVAELNRRLSQQVAALAPSAAPRKDPPLAAQPSWRSSAHVMPNDTLKVEPADGEIPLAGDVPTWDSQSKPDAPSVQPGPRATP